jgi:peptidoglycan/xylan/chitin deacetylase (PgdA/CDA1 family)
MTWEQVAQLAGDGHEIGSHGRDHSLLPQLAEDQQRADIVGSRDHIAAMLGSAPRSFCYPNGDYDERTLRLTAAAGYANAVTTQWGRNDRDRQPHELLRCDIDARRLTDRNGAPSLARLALRLSGYQPGLRGR